MKNLLPILLLFWSFTTRAATITANSVNYHDVTNAIGLASSGDTVQIPAGFAVWTNSETTMMGITLQGALVNGTNGTIIAENFNASSSSFNRILILIPTNTVLTRITQITFMDGGESVHNFKGKMEFDCRNNLPGAMWRLDHCVFNNLNGEVCFVNGWANCVADHNIFVLSGAAFTQYGNTFTDPFGDVSYATPPFYGTNVSPCSPLYLEDNIFTNIVPSSSSSAAYDAFAGARVVFRHNAVLNTFFANHGNDTSDRIRSARSFEIYNNVFSDSQAFVGAMDFRGGTGVIFSNQLSGFKAFNTAENYRAVQVNYWGGVTGTNNWDTNDGVIYATGINTGVSGGLFTAPVLGQGTVTVAGTPWVAHVFAGFVFDDASAGCYDASTATWLPMGSQTNWLIQDNSANQLFFTAQKDNILTVTNGDHFSIRYCIASIDQVGRGSGDLLTDIGTFPTEYTINTVSGTNTNPREISETLYCWSNTMSGTLTNFTTGFGDIVEGRDFTNNAVKPGYIPMTYPHPLVTGGPAVIPPAITGNPISLVVTNGNPASFTVTASGSVPLFYQWFFQNTATNEAINLATASLYTILSVATNNNGNYYAVVTNSAGVATSGIAALTVFVPFVPPVTIPTNAIPVTRIN